MIEPKPDLTNIKIEYIWVDIETVARLKKITKRAVRMSLNNDKYESKTERMWYWSVRRYYLNR